MIKNTWAHYEALKTIIGIYIALFFITLFVCSCLSCLMYSKEIDTYGNSAIQYALIRGLKWYGVIILFITIAFIILFISNSDRVIFTDREIFYYKYLFSKKERIIQYDEITECVIVARLWNDKRNKTTKRRIVLFHKTNILITFDIYSKLVLLFSLHLDENKLKVVTDNGKLNTIGKFYDIDFNNLSLENKLKIIDYYCKPIHKPYKPGKEILK